MPRKRMNKQEQLDTVMMEMMEPRLLLSADVLISEFMAINQSGLTDFEGTHPDWIELYNQGDQPEDLSGWFLTDQEIDKNKWEIPDGTVLNPGEYKIVFASGLDDPTVDTQGELHANFKLNGDGGYLGLYKSNGVTVAFDLNYPIQLPDVSYSSTPAPVWAGSDLQASAYVPTTASSIDSKWMNPSFNDSSWMTGEVGVGYDVDPYPSHDFTGKIGIDLEDQMRDQNGSAYIRVSVDIEKAAVVQSLSLNLQYDDGFVAYLNGQEVARDHAPAGTPAWNALATDYREDTAVIIPTEINLDAYVSLLVEGENVIAIHGLNRTIASSDFLIYPEIDVSYGETANLYHLQATPGEVNAEGYVVVGPRIDSIEVAPVDQPLEDQDIEIVVDTDKTSSHFAYPPYLHYRVNGGAWADQMMTFTGSGDFKGTILQSEYVAGDVVDWYLSVEDSAGNVTNWPHFLEGQAPAYKTVDIFNPNPDIPGDTNGDKKVDLQDLVTVGENWGFGPGATLQQGDVTGNGWVDLEDLVTISENWGNTADMTLAGSLYLSAGDKVESPFAGLTSVLDGLDEDEQIVRLF